MKGLKRIATGTALALGLAAGSLGAALPAAHAYPVGHYTGAEDSAYVLAVESTGIYNGLGPAALAEVGHEIANDIGYGRRDPLQERNVLYQITPASISVTDANVLVNDACAIYLHIDTTTGSYA